MGLCRISSCFVLVVFVKAVVVVVFIVRVFAVVVVAIIVLIIFNVLSHSFAIQWCDFKIVWKSKYTGKGEQLLHMRNEVYLNINRR